MSSKVHTPAEMADIKIKVDNMMTKMLHQMEVACGVSVVARGNPMEMTVSHWLSRDFISKSDLIAYPNARTAYDIRNSPLGKAMA